MTDFAVRSKLEDQPASSRYEQGAGESGQKQIGSSPNIIRMGVKGEPVLVEIPQHENTQGNIANVTFRGQRFQFSSDRIATQHNCVKYAYSYLTELEQRQCEILEQIVAEAPIQKTIVQLTRDKGLEPLSPQALEEKTAKVLAALRAKESKFISEVIQERRPHEIKIDGNFDGMDVKAISQKAETAARQWVSEKVFRPLEAPLKAPSWQRKSTPQSKFQSEPVANDPPIPRTLVRGLSTREADLIRLSPATMNEFLALGKNSKLGGDQSTRE